MEKDNNGSKADVSLPVIEKTGSKAKLLAGIGKSWGS